MQNEVSFEYVVSIRPKSNLDMAVKYHAPSGHIPAKLALSQYNHQDITFHFGVQILEGGLAVIFPSGGDSVISYQKKGLFGIEPQVYFEKFDKNSPTQGWWLSVDFARKAEGCRISTLPPSSGSGKVWSVDDGNIGLGSSSHRWEIRKVRDN